MINVLAIGDINNVINSISKVTKRTKIHIVNFPKDGAGIFLHEDNVDRFDSWKVKDQIEHINKIKNKFDICIVMGTGERIAYLCDLNYMSYYVGRDIDAPRFIKNSKEIWFKTPLHKLNMLERKFYRKTFDCAIAHISGLWVFPFLKRYDKNAIRMDMMYVDKKLFKNKISSNESQNKKFTFFSPVRMGLPKGTDLLWDAVNLCKSDFEILQVEWFDTSNQEEEEIQKQLLRKVPDKIKFIPMIKRELITDYYNYSDAVLGSFRVDSWELVEMEAILSGKPVISYNHPNQKYFVKNQFLDSPFIPKSNKPEDIAKIIDMFVESKDFREDIFQKQMSFVKESTDEDWIGDWWDKLFSHYVKKYKNIERGSSSVLVKIRIWYFIFANRLYWKKIKKM